MGKKTLKGVNEYGVNNAYRVNTCGMSGKRLKGTLVGAVNARRDETEKEVWRPAGMPQRIGEGGRHPVLRFAMPGAKFSGADAAATLWLKGTTLWASTGCVTDSAAEELSRGCYALGTVKSTPILADNVSEGTVRVMLCHEKPVYLTYDAVGKLTWFGEMPPFAGAGFEIADEVTLSEPIADVKLTGLSNSVSGPLTAEDCARVTKCVVEAYDRLLRRASRMGYMIQPVLSRWRMTDRLGDTVAVGPLVAGSAAGGFQCCGEVTMTSSDGLSTLSGGALTARGYRLRPVGGIGGEIVVTDNALKLWMQLTGTKINAETSPQIDPVDRAEQCVTAVSNDGRTTTVTLRLPGIDSASATGNSRRRRLVADALKRFLSGADACRVTTRRDDVSYSAACRCGGGVAFMADPKQTVFDGYSAREVALSANGPDGSWRGVTAVRIAGAGGVERTVVRTCSGADSCPSVISPLLIYPDENATEMTVSIETSEGVATGSFPLTPVSGSGFAYYLAGEVKPMRLAAGSASPVVPVATASGAVVKPGTVRIFRDGRRGDWCAETACDESGITALMRAPRGRGLWDYSREKVMVYSRNGVSVLSPAADGTGATAMRTDLRAVGSPTAVKEATGSNGLTHIAIAGGDLVEVDRSGVRTLLCDCKAIEAARSGRFDEIWLRYASGELRRLTADGELIDVAISGSGKAEWMATRGNSLIVGCENGIYDTGNEVRPTGGIEWSVTERFACDTGGTATQAGTGRFGAPQLRWLAIDLLASSVKGSVTLGGDNGTRVAETLLRLNIDGALNAPIRLPSVAPGRSFLECALRLTSSPDAEWHGLRNS